MTANTKIIESIEIDDGSGSAATEQKAYVGSAKGPNLIREMGFWKVVREDFRTHRKMALAPGFHAILVYRFGTWVDTINFKPLYIIPNLIWHLAYRWIRNFYGIEIEKTVKVGRRLELGHQHCIVIHANATIGDDVLIRHNVTFGTVSYTHLTLPTIYSV